MKLWVLTFFTIFLCFGTGFCNKEIPTSPDYFYLECINPGRAGIPVSHTTVEYKNSKMVITFYLSKFLIRYKYINSMHPDRSKGNSLLSSLINTMNYLRISDITWEEMNKPPTLSFTTKYKLVYRKDGRKYTKYLNMNSFVNPADLNSFKTRLYYFTLYFKNITAYRKNGIINYWR
jgi:hypothetical protein